MTDGLSKTTQCRCGMEVARNARRTHERRVCTARPRPVRKTLPEYSPRRCERAACSAIYRPKSSKQKYCSRECWILVAPERDRKMIRIPPQVVGVEVASVALDAKQSDMLTRCTVTGWGIEHRRERSYQLWGECLGVNLEAA